MNVIKPLLLSKLCYFYLPIPKTKGMSYSVRYALKTNQLNQFVGANRSICTPTTTMGLNVRFIHMLNESHYSRMSASEIKSKIKTRFKFSEGHTCIKIDCPSCFPHDGNAEDVSNLKQLCINSKTGNVFCPQCFINGSWSTFESYMQTSKSKATLEGVKSSMLKLINASWFEWLNCLILPMIADYPRITDFLSVFRPSQIELDEMKRYWNLAQPVDSFEEEELAQFLGTLHLEVKSKYNELNYDITS